MKKILLFGLIAILASCKTTTEVVKKEVKKKEIEVLCLASQCSDEDPLSLFKFNGIGFTKIKKLDKLSKDSFRLRMPQGAPQFLYIGTAAQAKLPIVLSDENMIVEGSCKAYRNSKIANSEYNTMYNEILKEVRENKRSMQMKLGDFRKAARNPDRQNDIKGELAKMDQAQLTYLDSIKKQKPFLANVVGLGTMMSFPNKAGEYNNNEVDFFAAEYFKNADLTNPEFNKIPYLFEAFKEFSQTLASVGLEQQIVERLINQNLDQVPASSNALRYALGGTALGLQGKNHPSFVTYGNMFIEKFGTTTDIPSVNRLRDQLNQAKSFVTGGTAPEIAMKNEDGEIMRLSEMRGKVVLIDFWASWCGPCRKENPNVVRAYNKYKEKGFEILGVSLDKTKDRWLKAIEKDGLTWAHVSDLKGWKNEAAKTYGVRSIPATVLVDKEGRIIARNLRGPALERKLAEIFD